MTGRRWLLILVAGAALTLVIGRALAQIYTDYLWFAALGAADIWRAKYSALTTIRVICASAATLFLFANLYAVRQSVVSLVLPRRIGNLNIGEEVPRRQLTWTAFALSLIIGLGLAWPRKDWSAYVAAQIGQPFGESDPYFAADLGFFVYRLPLELSLFTWTLTVVLIVIGIVLLLYALTPSLRWEQRGLYVSGYVRRHLTMLAGVLLLVLAWHYRLEMYTILGSGSSADGAFSYIDHRVRIPASLLLSLVTLGAGLTVLWAGWTGQVRLAFAALTGVLVAALAARQMAPFIAKRAVADRDPVVRERPYEATRAGYTRRAFAVDRVQPADSSLPFVSLAEAAPHIPVWDDAALRRASDRALPGSGVGWSAADAGIIAIVPTTTTSAGMGRAGGGGWVSGGGIVSYLASGADESGTPPRVLRSDGRTEPPALLIVADSSARSTVVADSSGHIAAPSLTPVLARFAHALSLQDFRVWFGALPSPAPKLVTRRTVRERVSALVPFFAQGTTVTPVWFADSLVWAVELYSASSTYPLSRRVIVAGAERAYFQRAATALVNATTGRTMLVADSLPDPIAATWMARFPRLFVRPAALPANVRRQLPPARDGARAQASAFGRFGTREESNVVRYLADDDGPDSALVGTPAPLIVFPRLGTTGYVLPLLDQSGRLRGLFVALGGTQNRSVWLPAGQSAPIWGEALDRLRATDTVSASLLVRGYVRALPVGSRIVLVQPRFEWRGSIAPRLLYVTALSGDSVRADRTVLELAGHLPAARPIRSEDFAARVRELYIEMRRASARGDWAGYGRAFDALGALLAERQRQE